MSSETIKANEKLSTKNDYPTFHSDQMHMHDKLDFEFYIYHFIIIFYIFYFISFFCISHFCHTCFPLPCGAGSTVPREGFELKCYYAFFLVSCGCDTSYIVSFHIQRQASIYNVYTIIVSRAFLAGAASRAGDSSRAPGLTSGLQGP